MKTNDKDSFKVPEKSTYKRKYFLRRHEEHEAEKEIKEFKLDELDTNEDLQTRSKPD